MKKKVKELIIIIPLIAILSFALVGYTLKENVESEQTHTGLFVEYKGEMIGGDIQGNIIILENGTNMGLDEFKRITGYSP